MRITALPHRLADLTFGTFGSRIYLAVVAAVTVGREVCVRFTARSHSASLDMSLTLLTAPASLLLDPLEYLATLRMTGTPSMIAGYASLLAAALVQAALIGSLAHRAGRRPSHRAHA
ncbi:SCO4225 family membrane protein [Streptomyces sp. NPDC057616]|uniref:SCO4225 family membrane protein n=1 Tax=Streptomyces sp. NPDC057616 TaxID=3346183 RepID=UPI0036AF8C26